MRMILSLMLTIIMLFSVTITAYADTTPLVDTITLEATTVDIRVQREIERMEEIVWADLYTQLEAQDALDGIEYFKEALRPEIEMVVYEKYGIQTNTSSRSGSMTFHFTNGGAVAYEGSLNTENVVVCMTPEQAEDYIEELNVTIREIIEAVVTAPFEPSWLSTLATFGNMILREMGVDSIEAADNYAKVMAISWGSGLEYGTYSYGWTTHPICTITDSVSITGVWFG